MGQQQLLLLIVGIVIVGLAVSAGLSAYEQQQRANEADAVLSRTLMMAQAAIEWRARDEVFGGGGGGSYAPLEGDGIDLLLLDMSAVRTQVVVPSASSETIEIVAVSQNNPEVGARVTVNAGYVIDSDVRMDGSIGLPE